jgi:16S rRNA (guanine527-N7)-methyltransferase
VTPEIMAALLKPYVKSGISPQLAAQLTDYLELLLKWNARTNLTAIREPEEIVRRHFGESLFLGEKLGAYLGAHLGDCATLLDFGSGAGFPGVPVQLLRPEIAVTLAESQGKKAAFLREVVRHFGLKTEVWPNRVETMPPERRFDAVALRAVDKMESAVREAAVRASRCVLILGTSRASFAEALAAEFSVVERLQLPGSADGMLEVLRRR